MDLDAPICLCFNVSRRKILRFIKVEKPRRASQLSECFGAGTGCGWCRQILERLNQQHSVLAQSPDQFGAKKSDLTQQDRELADATEPIDQHLDSLDPLQYQAARQAYRDQKRDNPQSADTHDPLSGPDPAEDDQGPDG